MWNNLHVAQVWSQWTFTIEHEILSWSVASWPCVAIYTCLRSWQCMCWSRFLSTWQIPDEFPLLHDWLVCVEKRILPKYLIVIDKATVVFVCYCFLVAHFSWFVLRPGLVSLALARNHCAPNCEIAKLTTNTNVLGETCRRKHFLQFAFWMLLAIVWQQKTHCHEHVPQYVYRLCCFFALAALTGDKMYSLHASNVGKSGALTFFCDQQVVTEEHYSH